MTFTPDELECLQILYRGMRTPEIFTFAHETDPRDQLAQLSASQTAHLARLDESIVHTGGQVTRLQTERDHVAALVIRSDV